MFVISVLYLLDGLHLMFLFIVVSIYMIFSARCNIYISRLCYDVSVLLSVRLIVTEVHWRIIAYLGFKFRSKFNAHCGNSPQCACMHCELQFMRAHCGRSACREEGRGHFTLC